MTRREVDELMVDAENKPHQLSSFEVGFLESLAGQLARRGPEALPSERQLGILARIRPKVYAVG